MPAVALERRAARSTVRISRRSQAQLSKRTAQYLDRIVAVHGARYIYGSEHFGRINDRIAIICREHGSFSQRLDHHLRGAGCPRCSAITVARAKRRAADGRFTERATQIHGGRYDYAEVRYYGARTEVVVVCSSHGPFRIKPTDHLSGKGCRTCGYERVSAAQSVTQEHVISRYREVHGDRYDYSLVRYTGGRRKVSILCPDHGLFETTSSGHAAGAGCPKCAWDKLAAERRFTKDQLKDRLQAVHGDRYSYDYAGYTNTTEKLQITCKKHGQFLQQVSSHLSGAGCPRCACSRGERKVAAVLTSARIEYVAQFTHETCIGKSRRLRFDFAIPSQHVLIEFDGVHHRKPVRWAYSITEDRAEEVFRNQQRLDATKSRWASDNGWALIRLTDIDTVEADLIAHGVIA